MTGPTITFWQNLLETKGGSEWRAESWDPVFARLSEAKPFRGDREHPGWSAASFVGQQRGLEFVREVFALCLDFDKGETVRGVRQRLAGFFGILHTTRRHTADAPRFRVVLPLSRPVTADEYTALWIRFANWAGSVDQAPKDPSRFWFLPGVTDGGPFEAHRLTGEALDVDEWLTRPDPTPKPVLPPRQEPRRDAGSGDREARALAYLRRIDGAISGQDGSGQTWGAAIALARGFGLNESQTFSLLWNEHNPRCDPPWTEKELRHKARQAQNARVPLDYLYSAVLERDRSGRSYDNDRGMVQEQEIPPEPDYVREPGDDTAEITVEAAKPKPAVERYRVYTERQLAVEVFKDATCGEPARGFTTGIIELDELMCGIRPGHILLAAAMTSWGKSTWASMIATENRKAGVRVLVVSNEDQSLMYGRRLACSQLNINAMRLRDRTLKPRELSALGEFANAAPDEYMFLDAVGMHVEDVALAIRELCAECGFQLVIGDYLQRMKSKNGSMDRRNEVTHSMGVITDEIKRANAAGVMFSQLKRVDGKPPGMNDVKESGDVENMAEHVTVGWREIEKGHHGEPEKIHRRINLPKNKDGMASEDWMDLRFDEVRAAFVAGHVLSGAPARAANEAIRQFDDYGDNP